MKKIFWLDLFTIFLILTSCTKNSRLPLVADSGLLELSKSCQAQITNSTHYIAYLKQWHLGPKANTLTQNPTSFAQFENQQSIYKQVEKWVLESKLKTVLVEGCEGEINDSFSTSYNGHDLSSLRSLSAAELDGALTHLGIKLKARFGDQVKVLCGDDDKLVEKHALTFSDLRGFAGFYERLASTQKSDTARYERFLNGAKDALGLSSSSNADQVLSALRERILSKIDLFESLLHQRNDAFMAKLASIPKNVNVAIILGGLHADDLFEKLEKKNEACDIFTPKGYPRDEGPLLKLLKDKFNHHPVSQ